MKKVFGLSRTFSSFYFKKFCDFKIAGTVHALIPLFRKNESLF